VTFFNLRNLRLRPGEEQVDKVEIALEPLMLGGQRYIPVPEKVPAELRITKATTGFVFELTFRTRLHGPCFRCLCDTVLDLNVAAREYQATNPGGDEELVSPYVVDDKLDLSSWARDAVVLDLPDKILHDPNCAGLCPTCGKDLNVEPHEHEDDDADPRWAALERLREQL
jgi:DUF177 domain-containing protein